MFAPSLVEVEIGVCSLLCEVKLGGLYPSSVEVIVVVWLRAYPSVVRWCLRGVRYSLVVQILLGGDSLSGSPRWTR